MLKGRPHLCQYMPPCKDARRLVADPDNEPNFYRISRQYPLDGSTPLVEDTADDMPHAKRSRSDSATPIPQGLALGTNSLAGLAALGAPSPASLIGLMPQPQQQIHTGAVPSNQAATLLNILQAQNQKRKEEEQQRAMLAAILQQQGAGQEYPSTGNTNNLATVLGMLSQQ